jgi:hypothetical protein
MLKLTLRRSSSIFSWLDVKLGLPGGKGAGRAKAQVYNTGDIYITNEQGPSAAEWTGYNLGDFWK